jgi:hypothetical protein
MEKIKLHVNSFLFLNHFASDIKEDIFIDLPYNKELDEAILLINKKVSEIVYKQEEDALDMFLSKKYRELRDAEEVYVPGQIKKILREINAYGKKGR